MEDVFVSNEGNDENDGSSKEKAIRSLKRLNKIWRSGKQLNLVEGMVTFNRLVAEIED